MTERDLTTVKPALKTIAELTDIVGTADAVCTRIENRVKLFREFVNSQSAAIAGRRVPGLSPADEKRVHTAQIQEAISARKAADIKANDADIKGKLREAKGALEAGAVFYSDAASVLERRTLGNQKRATYAANMANAAPAAVRTAALTAIATGDEDLAAVVSQHLGNLPVGDRPYTVGSFLAEFGVADFVKYTEIKAYFDRRLQSAILESRFLTLGIARHTADHARAKIRNGMAPAPSKAAVFGDEE
ncbi:MAG: hypothetical protein U1E42_08390 [Rhodospirillales bacterium]